MLALIGGWLVKFFGSGILTPILAHLDQKAQANRDITVAGITADQARDIALVQGQIEANRLKGSSQASFWPLVYIIALPPAIHAGSVFFDSMSFWTPWGAHVVGAWGIAQPPGIYGEMQQGILTSFFYVAPALAAVKVIGAAITRR